MSLSALPPMRVPTLTEVVDWPPAELVVVEPPAPTQSDTPAEGEVAARIDHAVDSTTAELLIGPPNELPNELLNESPSEPTPIPVDVATIDAPASPSLPSPPIDETALTQRLLTDLQHHVDGLLEQQLRVAMQPLLNRMADTLAQQAREELASALRDMVALAVSREMIRLRAAASQSDPAEP